MAEAVSGEFGKQKVKIETNKRPINLGMIMILGGLSVVILANTVNLKLKIDESSDLKSENAGLESELKAATALGSAGVRFSGVSLNKNEEIIIEMPGTNANCQSISFRFEDTAEGWTLGLDQTDAAGRTYDQPTARDAASVEALVQDLCS